MVWGKSTTTLQAKSELARLWMHSLACGPGGGPPAPAAQPIIMVVTVRFPYATDLLVPVLRAKVPVRIHSTQARADRQGGGRSGPTATVSCTLRLSFGPGRGSPIKPRLHMARLPRAAVRPWLISFAPPGPRAVSFLPSGPGPPGCPPTRGGQAPLGERSRRRPGAARRRAAVRVRLELPALQLADSPGL